MVPVQGRRILVLAPAPYSTQWILVLSLQGDILQVVTHPTEPTATHGQVPRDLLLRRQATGELYYYIRSDSAGTRKYGMLALQGL